ncbi:MAG: hypothetical protein PUC73_11270 [Lachnospiraceae bacterium]|nr:hypothetical protein [Lachnospiraceae bacterium]
MKGLVDYVCESWPGWLCAAVMTVVGYLYAQVRASRSGIRALLRAEIIRVYNKYHDDKGYCPIYVKQSIEDIYKQYHALKGNGVGTHLYEAIMALPTEPPEKEDENE